MANFLHLGRVETPFPAFLEDSFRFHSSWSRRCTNYIAPLSVRGSQSIKKSRSKGCVLRVRSSVVDVLEKPGEDFQFSEAVPNELTCVMKFGGSSVASSERMKEVAELIISLPEERPVIVLSAMGKTTNKLLLAGEKAVACTVSSAGEKDTGCYVSSVSDIEELIFIKDLHIRTVDELRVERSIILRLENGCGNYIGAGWQSFNCYYHWQSIGVA